MAAFSAEPTPNKMIKKVARFGGLGGMVLAAATACQTVTMDRIKTAPRRLLECFWAAPQLHR